MVFQVISSFRNAIINVQLKHVRFGHHIRGKPPLVARSIRDRLDELNYKDELYTTRIDIGLPHFRKSASALRSAKLEHLKKNKADTNLEQLARSHKLLVDIKQVRNDWLKTLGPKHKEQIAKHYGIFEHLYGEGYFTPRVNMEVSYQYEDLIMPVHFGNVIKPIEAKSCPQVKYDECSDDSLWTLVLTSLDGHLTEEKEYVHWLVANIPGNNVSSGETIVEYLQPIPLRGTGFHRYAFVLYKQNEKILYDLTKVQATSPLESRTFVTREWYSKHQDVITPAGLAFFQADWDSSITNYFHNVLDIKEPEYEYEFPAPYIRPQEWFPLRKPFNIYMDKYRDPKQINKEFLLRKLKKEHPFKMPEAPLRFPNAHPLPKGMPSWLKLYEKKSRLGRGRVNDV